GVLPKGHEGPAANILDFLQKFFNLSSVIACGTRGGLGLESFHFRCQPVFSRMFGGAGGALEDDCTGEGNAKVQCGDDDVSRVPGPVVPPREACHQQQEKHNPRKPEQFTHPFGEIGDELCADPIVEEFTRNIAATAAKMCTRSWWKNNMPGAQLLDKLATKECRINRHERQEKER